MALVGSKSRRSATVSALEPGETLCVYREDFDELRRRHGSIDELLLTFLVSEVRMLNDRLLEALYVPVERRVLRCLAELTQASPDGDASVEIPLTQEELAELAGTTRATMNRILRDEQRRGNLELQRGRTIVLRRDEIAGRAHAR
jgi:CRP-like cAMP-binding protein